MSKKIIPYPGVEIILYEQFYDAVVNVVINGLPKEKWKYYVSTEYGIVKTDEKVIDEVNESAKKLIKGKDGKYKLKEPLGYYLIYIISGEKIFRLIPTSNVHKLRTYKDPNTYPMLRTIVEYTGDEYTVDFMRFFKFKSPDKNIAASFLVHYRTVQEPFQHKVRGKDMKALLNNLSLELQGLKNNITVSPSRIRSALESFYMDPYYFKACFDDTYDLSKCPTLSKLMSNYDNVKRILETLHKDPFSIEYIFTILTVPPLYVEEYRRAMLAVESMICPMINDRRCIIVRTSGEDTSFDKILNAIDELPKHKDGKTYIETTYGEIVKLGEVFTFGEVFDLANRVKWLE